MIGRKAGFFGVYHQVTRLVFIVHRPREIDACKFVNNVVTIVGLKIGVSSRTYHLGTIFIVAILLL